MTDCPSCRRELPDGARFCPTCGADAPGAAPADSPSAAPDDTAAPTAALEANVAQAIDTDATQAIDGETTEPIDADATQAIDATAQIAATHIMMPATGTWVCPGCGADAPADNAFCSRCGLARPEEPTTVLPAAGAACAACGAALSDDMQFCPRCGARRGEPETAASREQTMVVPGAATDVTQVAAPASSPIAPTPSPPPPPPPVAQDGAGSRPHRTRNAVIAALGLFLVAVAVFCVWWFALRDTGPAARQAFVEQAAPILTPVAAAQAGVSDVLARIHPSAAASSATPETAVGDFQKWQPDMAKAATKLVDAVAAAQTKADALTVADKAQPLLDQLRAALGAHADYGAALAGVGDDPASLTAELTRGIRRKAEAASAAYAALAASAPQLPRVLLTTEAHRVLSEDADAIAAELSANAVTKAYLQQVADLFDQTRSARDTAEGVLDQFVNTQIPADNAAGQMQGAGANLRAVLTQVDALTPPNDTPALQIQNDYHAAVQHWTAAARLYAKWMSTVWGYYQAQGSYPQPGQPLEADVFLDPSYQAAQKEQGLADQMRVKLAEAYDAQASSLGLPADYDSTAM